MVNRKMFYAALFAGLSLGVMAQQEPGQGAVPEAEVSTQQAISEEQDVMSMIKDCLVKDGKKYNNIEMQEGENIRKNGELFFISIGTGTIEAPRSHRQFAASRVAAYNKAMLAAKRNMVEHLKDAIQTETEHMYAEGSFSAPSSAEQPKPDDSSTLGKIHRLINAKLDKALRAEGIDPDKASKAALAKAAKNKLKEESFSKLIAATAQAYVCGMQVYKSFEYSPANKKGQIGVITIWSPKLQKMAEAMLGNGTVPSEMPKRPIFQQIPSDPAVLLTTFGVQQKVNENGNLVLVSFGQEGAITDSPSSANAAYRKAQLNAMAGIREFAGENVAVLSDGMNAESFAEFENAADEYNNSSLYQEKIKAVAGKQSIRFPVNIFTE